MKKISLWLLTLVFTASLVHAQGTAAQQQIDQLNGKIQDMSDTIEGQRKQIAALERELGELRDKVNTPAVHEDYANRDDLKRLAEQVQEIDRKRADDREEVLRQLDKIAKAAANTPVVTPLPPPHHSTPKPPADDTGASPDTPTKGYYYEVKPGDTLGLIVKAYRDQGVKVTSSQIKKANPKMNPEVLIPGKKIFIPDPTAK